MVWVGKGLMVIVVVVVVVVVVLLLLLVVVVVTVVVWPALVGGQVGAQGAHPLPTWPPTKAGQATMYVDSPPCMDAPPCIWVPHHVFESKVSSIVINQALRKEIKTSEQIHGRAVRKVPTNAWDQGLA